MVWALYSFRIFFWSELCWRALKERNSWCEQIDFILRSLTLLSWPLCPSRRVATAHNSGSDLIIWALRCLTIFFWADLCWWALKERNSCCLQVDRILRFLALLNWVVWSLCFFRVFYWSELSWWAFKEQNSRWPHTLIVYYAR